MDELFQHYLHRVPLAGLLDFAVLQGNGCSVFRKCTQSLLLVGAKSHMTQSERSTCEDAIRIDGVSVLLHWSEIFYYSIQILQMELAG